MSVAVPVQAQDSVDFSAELAATACLVAGARVAGATINFKDSGFGLEGLHHAVHTR